MTAGPLGLIASLGAALVDDLVDLGHRQLVCPRPRRAKANVADGALRSHAVNKVDRLVERFRA